MLETQIRLQSISMLDVRANLRRTPLTASFGDGTAVMTA
jgi:hypothetical protein